MTVNGSGITVSCNSFKYIYILHAIKPVVSKGKAIPQYKTEATAQWSLYYIQRNYLF